MGQPLSCGNIRKREMSVFEKTNNAFKDCDIDALERQLPWNIQEDVIIVSGDTDEYKHIGGSGGNVTTYFCKSCNTRVEYFFDMFDVIVMVPIGCFDEVKSFEPKLEIWTKEKLSWMSDNGCFIDRVQDMGVQERLMTLLASLEDRWTCISKKDPRPSYRHI